MTTAVATQSKVGLVKKLLGDNVSQIARMLPRSVPSERFLAIWLTTFADSKDLQACTVESFARCVLTAAQLGGMTPGPRRQCYAVPYRNKDKGGVLEAQLIVGYQGLMTLCRNSDRIERFEARQVYEGDRFVSERGMTPKLVHEQKSKYWDEPDPTKSDPHITHFYALAELKSGRVQFEVMTRKKVEGHRDRYSKAKDGKAWRLNFAEMGCKTVVIELCNWLPSSDELQTAVTITKQADADVPQSLDGFGLSGPGDDLPQDAETPKTDDVMRFPNYGPRANLPVNDPTVNFQDLEWYRDVITKGAQKPERKANAQFAESDVRELAGIAAEITRRQALRPAVGTLKNKTAEKEKQAEAPKKEPKETKEPDYPEGYDAESFAIWCSDTMQGNRVTYYAVKKEMNLPADKPIPAGRRCAFMRLFAERTQGSQGE